MRQINTEGIILGKKSYGEGHELVFIFSKELGRITTQAKGSRKIKSKFLGHLETFNICNLQLYHSPHSYLITECSTVHPFKFDNLSHLHTDYALKVASFLLHSLAEAEPDIPLYMKIKEALSDFTESSKPLINYLQICTNLINHLGFFSDFSNTCPNCLNDINPNSPLYLFNNEVLFCGHCPEKSSAQNLSIPGKYRQFLNYLSKIPAENKNRLKISEEERFYLEKLVEAFFKVSHK